MVKQKENPSFGCRVEYLQFGMLSEFQERFCDADLYMYWYLLSLNRAWSTSAEVSHVFWSDSEQPWEDVNMMHSVCVGGHTMEALVE